MLRAAVVFQAGGMILAELPRETVLLQNLEKLKALLTELFHLDQADLSTTKGALKVCGTRSFDENLQLWRGRQRVSKRSSGRSRHFYSPAKIGGQ